VGPQQDIERRLLIPEILPFIPYIESRGYDCWCERCWRISTIVLSGVEHEVVEYELEVTHGFGLMRSPRRHRDGRGIRGKVKEIGLNPALRNCSGGIDMDGDKEIRPLLVGIGRPLLQVRNTSLCLVSEDPRNIVLESLMKQLATSRVMSFSIMRSG
jgi:hypothetical protein